MMNGFIRKILAFIEAFSEDFKLFIFANLFEICLLKVNEMFEIPEMIDKDLLIDENNDLLILEFAETIQRLPLLLLIIIIRRLATVVDSSLDENIIFELINCGSPSI